MNKVFIFCFKGNFKWSYLGMIMTFWAENIVFAWKLSAKCVVYLLISHLWEFSDKQIKIILVPTYWLVLTDVTKWRFVFKYWRIENLVINYCETDRRFHNIFLKCLHVCLLNHHNVFFLFSPCLTIHITKQTFQINLMKSLYS